METYSLKINMSKSIQLKNKDNEKMYPHPYYPVGSIYLSVVDTNPSTWFGGTWELVAKGRTLVGVDTNDTDFNTVKKTGGSKTVTLTTNQIPAHNHGENLNNNWGGKTPYIISGGGGTTKSGFYVSTDKVSSGNEPQNMTDNTGGGQAHNNLQPYFTCYIWCRTA